LGKARQWLFSDADKKRFQVHNLSSNQKVLEGNKMKSFLLDDTGLELSEYAVAAALVTIAVAGAFTALGDVIGDKINVLVTRVTG
jgi:Flp pilus assembly pilin Flp